MHVVHCGITTLTSEASSLPCVHAQTDCCVMVQRRDIRADILDTERCRGNRRKSRRMASPSSSRSRRRGHEHISAGGQQIRRGERAFAVYRARRRTPVASATISPRQNRGRMTACCPCPETWWRYTMQLTPQILTTPPLAVRCHRLRRHLLLATTPRRR